MVRATNIFSTNVECHYEKYMSDLDASSAGQGKRVSILYLDSVEHFRPRSCRGLVLMSILKTYLATTRARGYKTPHIWACLPARVNSFVFLESDVRTVDSNKGTSHFLVSCGALHRVVDTGVVTVTKSMAVRECLFGDFMSKAMNSSINGRKRPSS